MNTLPETVLETIEALALPLSQKELQNSASRLSSLYRSYNPVTPTIQDHIAYLSCRMPATFAACREVFYRLRELLPNFTPTSFLDYGAGPATAYFAVRDLYDTIASATLIERDPSFISLGKKLIAAFDESKSSTNSQTTWKQIRAEEVKTEPHDIVSASYMLSELTEESREHVIKNFWNATTGALVLVEPGTPKGYATLMQARTILLGDGATIVAPCPHQLACPMSGHSDAWCHFSIRLARTKLHKNVKDAKLGYEDEKFSYLIAAKACVSTSPQHSCRHSRIVGHIAKHSGHLNVALCTPQGTLEEKTISKRHNELYKIAKKASWGDVLPET